MERMLPVLIVRKKNDMLYWKKKKMSDQGSVQSYRTNKVWQQQTIQYPGGRLVLFIAGF